MLVDRLEALQLCMRGTGYLRQSLGILLVKSSYTHGHEDNPHSSSTSQCEEASA